MKKRSLKRFCSFFLAICMMLTLCMTTDIDAAEARAEEIETDVEETGTDTEEVKEDQEEPVVEEDQEEANDLLSIEAAAETVEESDDEITVDAQEVEDESLVGEKKLVYGDASLSDADAFVLTMFGDGFTADQQDDFYTNAKSIAEYVMKTSPYDEFSDIIKIYAIGTISNESGARADQATSQAEADADTRDTYFGLSFWGNGMQRLVVMGSEGKAKVQALVDEYNPYSDFSVCIANASTYGGSGGDICLASLNRESYEMMLHELGHTIAKLADEYYEESETNEAQYANKTSNNDPDTIKWARFVGKNGVGIYEYDNGGDGWYRPSQNCKMRYLGAQYDFCEVCKERIRQAFCDNSNITKMYLQTYADSFYEPKTGTSGKDMSEYFIIRKGTSVSNGAELGDAFSIKYYDENDNEVSGVPYEAGTYKMVASFSGNSTFDAATCEASYTIELPDYVTLSATDKQYDGEPAEVACVVDTLEEGTYTVAYHYTGTIPYSRTGVSTSYDSDEAPITPGNYTVTATVTDTVGRVRAVKSADYSITFKVNTIQNNNTSDYPGAAVYFNNKTIVLSGEGFTSEEQDKFEAMAKEYVEYIRSQEPFKECDIYMNFSSVDTISKESGVSTSSQKKDTYYKLMIDDNGKIQLGQGEDVDFTTQASATDYIGYNQVTAYYKANIVIVNDDQVKDGAINNTSFGTRIMIYAGGENGKEYAARTLRNYFCGYISDQDKAENHEPSTDEEKAEDRYQFVQRLFYSWGTDYVPIVSHAYNETIVETGYPIDMSPYFECYYSDQLIDVNYNITYYSVDSETGEKTKLDSAPADPGDYYAVAELDTGGAKTMSYTVNGKDVTIAIARGVTSYTINADANIDKLKDEIAEKDTLIEQLKNQIDTLKTKNSTVTVTKAKNVKTRSIQVTWKKYSGAKGYEVQYATNKSFKSAKKVTVSTNTKKLTKLTKKKTYYVRVRAYKVIGGKKVYTKYSSVKKVTVKA